MGISRGMPSSQVVPSRWICSVSRTKRHIGPNGVSTERHKRTVAGDVLAVPAPAEHEHVDPLAFHRAEHTCASLDPQLVEVDAGAVFGGHEAERLHAATAVTRRTPSSSNVGPTRAAIGASASRSKP